MSTQELRIISIEPKGCVYGNKGYPKCHCNNCLDAIVEYGKYKKSVIYSYKGVDVTIASFCPLEHCCPIFIQGIKEPSFCAWLNWEEAEEWLLRKE